MDGQVEEAESHGLVKLSVKVVDDGMMDDENDSNEEDDDIFGAFGTSTKRRTIQAPVYAPSPTSTAWFLKPFPKDRVLSDSYKATLILQAASFWYAQRQYPKCLDTLAEIKAHKKGHSPSLEVVEMETRCWLRMGDPQKALDTWQILKHSDPASLFLSSPLFRLNGLFSEAIGYALDYLSLRTNDFKAWQELCLCFRSSSNGDRGLVAWAAFAGSLSLHLLSKSQKDHPRVLQWSNKTTQTLELTLFELRTESLQTGDSDPLQFPNAASLSLLDLSEPITNQLMDLYRQHADWYEEREKNSALA